MQYKPWRLAAFLIAYLLNAPCLAAMEARSGLMGCAANGQFYVAGGASSIKGLSNRFDVWHPTTKTWAQLPDLPQPRALGAMVAIRDRIYFIGGLGEDNRTLVDIHVFDIQLKRWRQPIRDPVGVNRNAAVAIGEDIYVIGGFEEIPNGESVVHGKRVRSFNITTGQWRECAPLNIGRHGHAAAVFSDRIFVTGGYSLDENDCSAQTRSVEIYNPFTNRWLVGPELQKPHAFHGLAAVNDRLFVFGTRGEDTTTEILEASTMTWVNGPKMPVPRHRFAYAAIDKHIFVVGGEDETGNATATSMIFSAIEAKWSLRNSDSSPPPE